MRCRVGTSSAFQIRPGQIRARRSIRQLEAGTVTRLTGPRADTHSPESALPLEAAERELDARDPVGLGGAS